MEEEYEGRKYFGKYKAYCRANDDPQGRGRIRCFCPQVMGPNDDAEHWLDWAEACLPWMGGLNTLDFGPPLTKIQNEGFDVGIWIEFEGGIPDFPVWVGTFLPAPLPTSQYAQVNLATATSASGGSIIANPPDGSDMEALNPPRPIPNSNELRLFVKSGRDIILGSQDGGALILGPSGAHLVGPQVTLNGRLVSASLENVVD